MSPQWIAAIAAVLALIVPFAQTAINAPTTRLCSASLFSDVVTVEKGNIVSNVRIGVTFDNESAPKGVSEGTIKIWNCGTTDIDISRFAAPVQVVFDGRVAPRFEGWSANFKVNEDSVGHNKNLTTVTDLKLTPGSGFYLNYSALGSAADIDFDFRVKAVNLSAVTLGNYSTMDADALLLGGVWAFLSLSFVWLSFFDKDVDLPDWVTRTVGIVALASVFAAAFFMASTLAAPTAPGSLT